jgi:amidohydrolase
VIDFLSEARSIERELSVWRRDFHQHPELRFEEFRTAEVVARELRELGLEVQTGVAGTGVVGLLKGTGEGPVVLLRADMDALPITEETGAEYASQNPGVMHACGHDTHMAVGLGVAKLLVRYRDQLRGTAKFVFQPAEEGAGGALAMIEAGVLENPRPDYSLGIHIDSQHPLGWAAIGEGPILAAADEFHILVKGTGGHGALPEQTVDALIVGTQIVSALQTIISRNTGLRDQAVLSVCSFNAGSTFNVIPDRAEISGTIRSYETETQALLHRRVREIVQHIAEAFGATAEVDIKTIVPAAINDPGVAELLRELGAGIFDDIHPSFRQAPSDDIAEFLLAAPGCQVMIGAELPNGHPHHTPLFDIDERAMPLAVALIGAAAFHYLTLESGNGS